MDEKTITKICEKIMDKPDYKVFFSWRPTKIPYDREAYIQYQKIIYGKENEFKIIEQHDMYEVDHLISRIGVDRYIDGIKRILSGRKSKIIDEMKAKRKGCLNNETFKKIQSEINSKQSNVWMFTNVFTFGPYAMLVYEKILPDGSTVRVGRQYAKDVIRMIKIYGIDGYINRMKRKIKNYMPKQKKEEDNE